MISGGTNFHQPASNNCQQPQETRAPPPPPPAGSSAHFVLPFPLQQLVSRPHQRMRSRRREATPLRPPGEGGGTKSIAAAAHGVQCTAERHVSHAATALFSDARSDQFSPRSSWGGRRKIIIPPRPASCSPWWAPGCGQSANTLAPAAAHVLRGSESVRSAAPQTQRQGCPCARLAGRR